MSPKRVAIIGFDRVTALHLIAPAEAFCVAALDDGYGGRIPCYEVCTLGADSQRFSTDSGLTFEAQATLATAEEFDTVIVAGGPGIRVGKTADTIASFLLRHAAETRRIATVCTGLYGLAPTGLLDDRAVTVHWRNASDVARRFPRLRVDHKRPLVQDGAFATSSGLGAGINLALALIRDDYGPYVAQAVEQELLLTAAAPKSESSPAPSTPFESRPNERFADLVPWMMRNLDGDLSVETLARRACMSSNHFSKAFKSVFGQPPKLFVENLRLHEARRRLSRRQKTILGVAASVGFNDAHAFQRAYQRRFGTRPAASFAESSR